jgi:hypothetical protein
MYWEYRYITRIENIGKENERNREAANASKY